MPKFQIKKPGSGRPSLPPVDQVNEPVVEVTVQEERPKPSPKPPAKPKTTAKPKTKATESTAARTRPIKFYVTAEDEQRFVEMLDGRSASKFLYKKFQEFMK